MKTFILKDNSSDINKLSADCKFLSDAIYSFQNQYLYVLDTRILFGYPNRTAGSKK